MILKRSVMKQLFKPLVFILCAGALASCSKKVDSVIPDATIVNPISDYTVTPDATDGFTFKFTNLSKNFTSIEWRFGDDTVSTAAAPTHTYLSTGDPAASYKYLADLKTVSSTGTISHKYQNILIAPDSIIQLSTVKTGGPAGVGNVELQFSAKVKGTVAKYLWTFVDNRTSTAIVTTSNLASPKVAFAIGSFNSFTLQITTNKGSVASLSRNVTTEGIAINFTQSYTNNTPLYPSTITNVENTAQGANEGSSKLVDGNIQTKFGYYSAFPQPLIITLKFPALVSCKIYGICNGNDSGNDRDPKEWYIEGSPDGGTTWVALDHITLVKGFYDMATDAGATNDTQRYRRWWYYPIATPGAYNAYRWRIISTFKSAFQISELAFFK